MNNIMGANHLTASIPGKAQLKKGLCTFLLVTFVTTYTIYFVIYIISGPISSVHSNFRLLHLVAGVANRLIPGP